MFIMTGRGKLPIEPCINAHEAVERIPHGS